MSRGRRPEITPRISLHVHLSQVPYAKMNLHLWSEVEGRVPSGAYSRFIDALILDFFSKQEVPNGTES